MEEKSGINVSATRHEETNRAEDSEDPRAFKLSLIYTVLRIQDVYPGSRILIFTHPGSRISDPGSKNSNKREGMKKNLLSCLFCSHKFHKMPQH
jgi:hypothetical protein